MSRRTKKQLICSALPALIAFWLVSGGNAWAQNILDISRCDSSLGRDYDRKSAEEKSARMTRYLNCRSRQDLNYLKSRHRDMQRKVRDWQARASRVTNDSLSTKRKFAQAEMKVVHDTARTKMKAKYDTRYADLNAQHTSENHYETNKKRNEITVEYRQAQSDLSTLHNDEGRAFNQGYRQCQIGVENRIKGMTAADSESLNAQYLDKSRQLSAQYDTLKSTPMRSTLNDAKSSQPNVSGAASSAGGTEPIGAVTGAEGSVTVTKPSGEIVQAAPGTPIYMGDMIETDAGSSCEILFADETTFSVSEDARLEIDEYVYDPDFDSSKSNFSILRGIFVFTSGLIGRKEPRDVDAPQYGGSSGIRG